MLGSPAPAPDEDALAILAVSPRAALPGAAAFARARRRHPDAALAVLIGTPDERHRVERRLIQRPGSQSRTVHVTRWRPGAAAGWTAWSSAGGRRHGRGAAHPGRAGGPGGWRDRPRRRRRSRACPRGARMPAITLPAAPDGPARRRHDRHAGAGRAGGLAPVHARRGSPGGRSRAALGRLPAPAALGRAAIGAPAVTRWPRRAEHAQAGGPGTLPPRWTSSASGAAERAGGRAGSDPAAERNMTPVKTHPRVGRPAETRVAIVEDGRASRGLHRAARPAARSSATSGRGGWRTCSPGWRPPSSRSASERTASCTSTRSCAGGAQAASGQIAS